MPTWTMMEEWTKKGEKDNNVSWAIGKFYTSFSTPFLLINFSYDFNSYIDDGCLSTAHIQCISHAEQRKMMGLWVEKDEGDATNGEYKYTPPLVLCHVTNESKVVFQLKHRLSPLLQENLKMAPVMHGLTTTHIQQIGHVKWWRRWVHPTPCPMPCH